jgi:hypothetical protein
MMKRGFFPAVLILVLAVVLAGCNLPSSGTKADPRIYYTQAAETMIAQMTYSAVGTEVVKQTQEAAVTSTPTNTPTPEVTNTPTAKPTSTNTPIPPTNTPVPVPCNALEFVTDITVDDGETMAPNEEFEKVWRIRNVGTCTWTTDYDLVFVDGDQMQGDKSVSLPNKVSPGNSIDVGVDLVAPEKKGTYTGYWMLRSSGGSYFGWGPNVENAFYVTIKVSKSASSNYDTPFYFADHVCEADWYNEDNDINCGDTGSSDGYAYLDEAPWIEKGGKDDEPAIVVHPENKTDGAIAGKFKPIEISDGDHFYAAIGCMKDETKCNVNFTLKVRDEDGNLDTLGTWGEKYDKSVTSINIDLSAYKDQKVTFYLIVDANGSSKDDRAFWLNPQIR